MHTAIIMDGNGRWAERRGLPRSAGHRAGAKAVRRIVEAATRGPIDILTLYAFSVRQLVAAAAGSREPDAPVEALLGQRNGALPRQRCPFERHRPTRSTEPRSRAHDREHRAHHGRGREAAFAARRRLFVSRRDRGSRLRARSPQRFRAGTGGRRALRRRGTRRLVDPHGRRTTPERLLALGVRLRGARVRRHVLARLRRSRVRSALREFARRDRRFGRVSGTAVPAGYSRAE